MPQAARAGAGTRVLMLTAAGGPRRAAEGLGLGADGYLAKPFDFMELIARVRGLARRPAGVRLPVLEAAGREGLTAGTYAVTASLRPELLPQALATSHAPAG